MIKLHKNTNTTQKIANLKILFLEYLLKCVAKLQNPVVLSH